MRRIYSSSIVLVILSLAGGPAGGWWLFEPKVEQPVQFSHEIHVGQRKMACMDCHRFYETGPAAGFPALVLCADCHKKKRGESVEEARFVQMVLDGAEVRWKRLYALPPHVYFSHRRHVVGGELACEKCHGAIAETSTPPLKPLVRLGMEDCLACHEDDGVNNDCLACHR